MNNKNFFLLTDTLPYEIPLIFDNLDFYNKINSNTDWPSAQITGKALNQTEPYNFFIYKDETSVRMISLVHPLAQLQFLKFIQLFDQDILDYFNTHVTYSIRYPHKVNSYIQKSANELKRELYFLLNEDFESITNETEGHIDSYFIKNKFVKITDFYGSKLLKHLETKYRYLLKTDIQSCFYNIYTHSIDWAYLGDKRTAKKYALDRREYMSSLLDKIMQYSNYAETNGIVVGPEFSRCVAEIVLTRIDSCVFNKLQEQNLVHKRDYEIVRFIDDIFIFSNDTKITEKCRKAYEEVCFEYKLSLNRSKTYQENRPFLRKHLWVIPVKKFLKEYLDKPLSKRKKIADRIDDNFIYDLKLLITTFEEQRDFIVSFILSFFQRNLAVILQNIDKLETVEEKNLHYARIIDVVHYVLVYSISSKNVIKYCYITSKIVNAAKNDNVDIENLEFKKAFELIKYNQDRNIELLNLLLVMKRNAKDLPEELLLKFVERDSGYLTISSVAYYMDTDSRRFKYRKVRKQINDIVQSITKTIIDEMNSLRSTNWLEMRRVVTSKEFYILHDFFSSRIIKRAIKNQIMSIKSKLNPDPNCNGEHLLYKCFLLAIKDFDKPFMNWDADPKDLAKALIRKSLLNEAGYGR